jgi:hypothetical protein
MQDWLDHPAVQGGVAPLVVALVVAAALSRTRFAWLAIVAGYLAMVALSTGFNFSPLTASRKTIVLVLAAPLVGIIADRMTASSRGFAPRLVAGLAAAVGILAIWVFASVLEQREGLARYGEALGVAVFVAALCWLTLRLRDDGLRAGAAILAGYTVVAAILPILAAWYAGRGS